MRRIRPTFELEASFGLKHWAASKWKCHSYYWQLALLLSVNRRIVSCISQSDVSHLSWFMTTMLERSYKFFSTCGCAIRIICLMWWSTAAAAAAEDYYGDDNCGSSWQRNGEADCQAVVWRTTWRTIWRTRWANCSSNTLVRCHNRSKKAIESKTRFQILIIQKIKMILFASAGSNLNAKLIPLEPKFKKYVSCKTRLLSNRRFNNFMSSLHFNERLCLVS